MQDDDVPFSEDEFLAVVRDACRDLELADLLDIAISRTEDPAGPAEAEVQIDITPRREGAAKLLIFAVGGRPTYLFVGDGPGYEFWRDDDEDVEMLRVLLEASLEGRYRFWTERQERRSPWRPRRAIRSAVTTAEWQTSLGPQRVVHHGWLRQGSPESGEPLPYAVG